MATGGDAQQKVNAPAMAMMISAIVGIVLQFGGIIYNVTMNMYTDDPRQFSENIGAALENRTPTKYPKTFNSGIYVSIFDELLCIGVGGLVVFGSMKMKNLQSHGLALTSSILSMIPCISPCCISGLPIGIWALVVLLKPEVKSAFR